MTANLLTRPDDDPVTFLEQGPARRAHIRKLEEGLTSLAAHIDAAMYRWLDLLREFDQWNGWAEPGIKSLAHWLNWKCGLGLGTARERIRVAQALKDLPQTSATFREGRISYAKVRAITRVATAGNEAVFLDIARYGTAWHVERVVRMWRREKRLEALQAENRRHALREVSWFSDDDGSLVLNGRFTPEQGAVIRTALEAMMETLFQEQRGVPGETSDRPDPLLPRSLPVCSRRADALARIAEEWLARIGAASQMDGEGHVNEVARPDAQGFDEEIDATPDLTRVPASCSSGDRFVVHIHTDLETLREDGEGAESELEDWGNVAAETSRRLACDAAVIHWLNRGREALGTGSVGSRVHDGRSGQGGPIVFEPLSVGRKTRTVPPSIRRALQRRDRGCRFPGCTCTRFVDAHHIHHWADGGATHLDNLVLLCRHHHRLVHEGGCGLRRADDGVLVFTNADGDRIPEVVQTRSRGNVFALISENESQGICITPTTGMTEWDGGSMDTAIIAQHLKMRDEGRVSCALGENTPDG